MSQKLPSSNKLLSMRPGWDVEVVSALEFGTAEEGTGIAAASHSNRPIGSFPHFAGPIPSMTLKGGRMVPSMAMMATALV